MPAETPCPTTTSRIPRVVFVCVKNGGKSQMAAGLMRQLVGDRADVDSAGTHPGTSLNELSVSTLREVGVDIEAEVPKAVTPALMGTADLVVTLGQEAHVEPVEGTRVENWDTDEPSQRGIDGVERMRLIRDDIAARVRELVTDLNLAPQDVRSGQHRQAGQVGVHEGYDARTLARRRSHPLHRPGADVAGSEQARDHGGQVRGR